MGFFFDQICRIIKNEELLHVTPDNDQVSAGIDKLTKFGSMATVYSLCNGDILKKDEVLRLPYNEVFVKLYYDKEVAAFQKRYSRVLNQKK